MSYEIKLGVSIGQIRLGMHRGIVNTLIRDLHRQYERGYGFYDVNDDFMIFYNKNNLVNCIKCISPHKLRIENYSLNSFTIWDLYLIVNDICDDLEFTHNTIMSKDLKFCIVFMKKLIHEDIMVDMIESVQIANKDFLELQKQLSQE